MCSLVTSKNVSWPRLIWPTLYVSCARTADFSDNLFTVYIYRPAPLRRLHDSGAGYKYSDLLTYFPAVVWPRVWPCQRDGIHLSGPCCLKDCENIRKRFFLWKGYRQTSRFAPICGYILKTVELRGASLVRSLRTHNGSFEWQHHFCSGKSSFGRTPRHACPFDKNTARPTEFPRRSPRRLERASITAPLIIR